MAFPCIPGIFGFGTDTRGAWGGSIAPIIIRVTNLNDSGTGSLRAALEGSSLPPRVVIFEISGLSFLSTDIYITAPFVTIAYQTAPVPGFEVAGFGVHTWTHDVLHWHGGYRPGDGPPTLPDIADHDAAEVYGGSVGVELVYNVVFANCSNSYAQGKNWLAGSIGTNAGVTWWQCIDAWGLYFGAHVTVPAGNPSSLGRLIAQSYSGNPANFSSFRSLYAHNSDRAHCEMQGPVNVINGNDVVYDWGKDGNQTLGPGSNIYPWSSFIYKADAGDAGIGPKYDDLGCVYVAGVNHLINGDPMPSTPLYAVSTYGGTNGVAVYIHDQILDQTQQSITSYIGYNGDLRVGSPTVTPPANMSIMAGSVTQDYVLAHAGRFPAFRDNVDTQVVSDVTNYTGNVIQSQTQGPGFPTLTVNSRALTTPTNPNADSGNGYTNMEVWLQGYAAIVEGTTPIPGNVTFAIAQSKAVFTSSFLSGNVLTFDIAQPKATFTGTFAYTDPNSMNIVQQKAQFEADLFTSTDLTFNPVQAKAVFVGTFASPGTGDLTFAITAKKAVFSGQFVFTPLVPPTPTPNATFYLPDRQAVVDPTSGLMSRPWFNALNVMATNTLIGPIGGMSGGLVAIGPSGNSLASANLSGDVTTTGTTLATLSASGVTAGTYGDSAHVAQVTIDAKGRVTAAANVSLDADQSAYNAQVLGIMAL